MPHFQVIPLDPTSPKVHVVSCDAVLAMATIQRMGVAHADVLCDSEYAFSVRAFPSGLMYIYQRPGEHRLENTLPSPIVRA